jgi:ribosomal protein S15P/S13E
MTVEKINRRTLQELQKRRQRILDDARGENPEKAGNGTW